ncbi:hypothetical protein BAE44_0013951 [Dichanthelium oligosanthes]|uniref:NAC domain-containing protein n=1 Tax=Dichanthelium oligosanthes TaxID=888268 RepID=A0A1E5VIV5_9POAL|nr:hypothetical protein BAE44_0013951 [Dichanthelium oligosanthes]
MATEDPAPRTSDDASIALLRGLRAGAVDSRYIHRVDVCSAAPEDLVADLQPVPGTGVADDGYSNIWYYYCPRKFKNGQGKASGHRQRAIAGGDTCWHAETRPKPVKDLDGATFRNLSYGRKDGSSRSFNRMGWCMTEYDDKEEGGGGGDHVLCKIHRSSSSLARGKLKPSSSSTRPASSKQTAQTSSGSKRKTTSDDHPQAPPNKIAHAQACNYACVDQEFCFLDHQVHETLLTDDQMRMPYCYQVQEPLLTHDQMRMPDCYQVQEPLLTHNQMMMPVEEEQVQQNPLFTMDEWLSVQRCGLFTKNDLLTFQRYCEDGSCSPTTLSIMAQLMIGCCGPPTATAPPDAAFFQGLAF